jgi:hypothetical protein
MSVTMASTTPIVSLAPISLFFPLGGVQLAREDSHLGQSRGVDQHLGDQGRAVERQLAEDMGGGLKKTNHCQLFFYLISLSELQCASPLIPEHTRQEENIQADM